jgi:hypothetical protein
MEVDARGRSRPAYRVLRQQGGFAQKWHAPFVPPLYPLTRAHESRAALSAVDSATLWGRLLAAVADSISIFAGFGANAGARALAANAAAPASYGVIAKVRH